MSNLTQTRKYSLAPGMPGLDDTMFSVVSFTAYESISQPYRYDILLVTDSFSGNLSDIDDLMKYPAAFIIDPDTASPIVTHGILYEFEKLHSFSQITFYRARLMPRLTYLSHTHDNRVLTGQHTIADIIRWTLEAGGLRESVDYELSLSSGNPITNNTGTLNRLNDSARDMNSPSYPVHDYTCQYNESLFNFLSRWLEHEGVYYHFMHTDGRDKIVFIDAHNMSPNLGTFSYNTQGVESGTIRALTSRHRQMPLKVVVRDYDFQKPLPQPIQQNPSAILANVESEAEVDSNGHGVVYLYGENFSSSEHGLFLAGIRAQELLCRRTQVFGESDIPRMSAGRYFSLGSIPESYLITEITHEGSQTQYLAAGVLNGIPGTASIVEYKNSFTALPKTTQFRPERKTTKTVVPGPITAFVESETSSSFAELDSSGRYKVRLPFDTDTARLPGKGSTFVRMAQPHGGIAGANGAVGAHFPLHCGTEVQLTFINGDPDRPIITGAAPCLNAPSPVTELNQTRGIIRDSYGNEIILDETPGSEHIRLHSPNNDATMEIGGGGVESYSSGDNTTWTRGNTVEVGAGTKLEGYIGAKSEFNIGFMYALKLAMEYEFSLTGSHKIAIGYEWNYSLGPKRDISEDDINSISHDNNIVSAGNTLCLIGGAGVTKVNDSTSIINANEQGIVFTVGNKKNPYEPGSDAITKKMCLGAALASAVSTLLMFGASECEAKDEKGGQITTIVFSSLAAAVSVALAGWYTYKLAKESNKIQLVEHDNPDTKIALNNDIITLERHFKSQGGQPAPLSSQIQLNDNVTILTHANNDNQCVIELDNNSGLYLHCEKGATNDMVGRISINQINGNIEISNLFPDSAGTITLSSNSDIFLNSDKENIIIQADNGDMEVNAKKFKWKGDTLDFGSLKIKQ